jgi:hypothetical protein
VRYFDGQRKRPGLPQDVAALVDMIGGSRVGLTLVNLHPSETREAVLQAGALGEHRFRGATFDCTETAYPGPTGTYAAAVPLAERHSERIDEAHLRVRLPPATEIHLTLEMDRFVNPPSYLPPGSEGLYG